MIKKQHFIFDFDDTLADGQLFCGEIMARVITSFEKEMDPQEVIEHHESIRGRSIIELYESAIEKFSLRTPIDKLLATDAVIMKSECYQISLFEGAKKLLKTLKSKEKNLHICTNRKSESLVPILKHNQINSYFDEVISCADMGFEKPHPRCLNTLIKKVNQPKERFLYIGDSEKDYLFARNARIDCLIFDQYKNDKKLFANLNQTFFNQH